MTREELLASLTGTFYRGFADKVAAQVLAADASATLYELAAVPPASLSAALRHRVAFRGAYVLERICFSAPELFSPFVSRFCRTDFPVCSDAGARRSFAKIMAHLLRDAALCDELAADGALDRIAETAAQWAIDPKTKIAVRIWCVEVVKRCRVKCPWVEAMWPDLLAALALDESPAIAARMRNGWRKM